MALNGKQRAAIFEKLKTRGSLRPIRPVPPSPHPKLMNPMTPPAPPMGTPPMTANQVNPNFVGQGKAQRFRKLKGILGV